VPNNPLNTFAEQAGRWSIRIGLIGWAVLAAGLAAKLGSKAMGDWDQYGVLGGFGVLLLVAGGAIVVGGLMVAAHGFTTLIHDVPDPGQKWVTGGMAVNGLPMVLVAGYVAYTVATS
jgi:hypothetical protein